MGMQLPIEGDPVSGIKMLFVALGRGWHPTSKGGPAVAFCRMSEPVPSLVPAPDFLASAVRSGTRWEAFKFQAGVPASQAPGLFGGPDPTLPGHPEPSCLVCLDAGAP